MTTAAPAHKRILLKLSGEALMGDDSFGINRATIVRMVEEIAEVTRLGVQVAVVIGGIFSVVWRAARSVWTGPLPTTWACWPRS